GPRKRPVHHFPPHVDRHNVPPPPLPPAIGGDGRMSGPGPPAGPPPLAAGRHPVALAPEPPGRPPAAAAPSGARESSQLTPCPARCRRLSRSGRVRPGAAWPPRNRSVQRPATGSGRPPGLVDRPCRVAERGRPGAPRTPARATSGRGDRDHGGAGRPRARRDV